MENNRTTRNSQNQSNQSLNPTEQTPIIIDDPQFQEFLNCLKQHHKIPNPEQSDWYLMFDFQWRKILISPKHGLWLWHSLTPRQKKYLGQKINPLTCWRKERLCEGEFLTEGTPPLLRPHFTCIICPLRKIIEGKQPIATPINLHLIFLNKNRPKWKAKIDRYLLTIAEALGY